MTREEILKLRQIAFKRFYSRPSFILKKLLQLRSAHDVSVAFKSLRSLFWLWTKSDLFRKKGGEPPAFES
jgi:hypothetical protein